MVNALFASGRDGWLRNPVPGFFETHLLCHPRLDYTGENMFAFPPPASSPRFLLDAWSADYTGSNELEDAGDADSSAFEVDINVETADWSEAVIALPLPRPGRIVFVDGTQRIEAWGRLESAEGMVEAALASVAVGAAVSYADRSEITFEEAPRVHRILAIGGGVSVAAMNLRAGRVNLRFEPENGNNPGRQGVYQAIGTRRRDLERFFAEKMTRESEDSLVVQDGRLLFDPGAPYQVVGMAKTMHVNYLAGRPQALLLSQLAARERTPVFRIHEGQRTRYSWYLRLPYTRPIHYSLAGIVRLETPEIGREAAIRLANLTTAHLPTFASRPEHDPRAPQNLLPIGALEKRLRHEMGDRTLMLRAIEDHLFGRANA